MALQENNLLDNRLPLFKLRVLLPRFKEKGVLRSMQEEGAAMVVGAMFDLCIVVDAQSVNRNVWELVVFVHG